MRADVFYHTWPLHLAMGKAFQRARYIEDSQGQPQKLLFAKKEGFNKVLVDPYKEER